MPLSKEQRAALEAAAQEHGVPAAELIAAAEEETAASQSGGGAANGAPKSEADSSEPPKLFQYHLSFVTVREVRQVWLKLTDPFPGDDEVAAAWSAKILGSATPPPSEPTPE